MKKYQNIYILMLILLFITPVLYARQLVTLPPTVLHNSEAIVLKSNTEYSGLRVANPHGRCLEIRGDSTNIVLTDSVIGPCKDEGIRIYKSSNITIQNSVFHDVASGVYAAYTTGNISIVGNKVANVTQLKITPTETKQGHFFQFALVSGAGNKIGANVGENIVGLSDPAEGINVFRSNGTVSNPIEVVNNSIRGGGYNPDTPASGNTNSGGILVGDGGGEHIHVKNNILVRPGLKGIAIAGGQYNKVLNNSIYSPQTPFSYAGLVVRLMQIPNLPRMSCSGHEVRGNKVSWASHLGTLVGKVTKDCGEVIGWETNDISATLSENILPDQLIEPPLKAHYSFDDSAEDKSGYTLNGIVTNATYISSGIGKAIRLNGVDSSINVPSSSFLHFSPFSVTSWVMPATLSSNVAIARSQNGDGHTTGWQIVANNSKLEARITTQNHSRKWDAASPVVSTDVSCDGLIAESWNFIAVIYDGKKLQCYVNGALGDSKTASGIIQYAGTSDMKIGESAGKSRYTGAIDEFKVFRGSLSSEQVRNTYESATSNFLGNKPSKIGKEPNPPAPPSLKVGPASP